MRAALGNTEFDRRFGSEGGPAQVRPLRVQARAARHAAGGRAEVRRRRPAAYGKRDVKVGDWVYFYNHPLYLRKHPGGAWQGENAVYTGDDAAGQQLFTGLGAAGQDRGRHARRDGGRLQRRARRLRLRRRSSTATPPTRRRSQAQEARYKARDTDYTRGALREVPRPDPAQVPRGRLPGRVHRSGDPRLPGDRHRRRHEAQGRVHRQRDAARSREGQAERGAGRAATSTRAGSARRARSCGSTCASPTTATSRLGAAARHARRRAAHARRVRSGRSPPGGSASCAARSVLHATGDAGWYAVLVPPHATVTVAALPFAWWGELPERRRRCRRRS